MFFILNNFLILTSVIQNNDNNEYNNKFKIDETKDSIEIEYNFLRQNDTYHETTNLDFNEECLSLTESVQKYSNNSFFNYNNSWFNKVNRVSIGYFMSKNAVSDLNFDFIMSSFQNSNRNQMSLDLCMFSDCFQHSKDKNSIIYDLKLFIHPHQKNLNICDNEKLLFDIQENTFQPNSSYNLLQQKLLHQVSEIGYNQFLNQSFVSKILSKRFKINTNKYQQYSNRGRKDLEYFESHTACIHNKKTQNKCTDDQFINSDSKIHKSLNGKSNFNFKNIQTFVSEIEQHSKNTLSTEFLIKKNLQNIVFDHEIICDEKMNGILNFAHEFDDQIKNTSISQVPSSKSFNQEISGENRFASKLNSKNKSDHSNLLSNNITPEQSMDKNKSYLKSDIKYESEKQSDGEILFFNMLYENYPNTESVDFDCESCWICFYKKMMFDLI